MYRVNAIEHFASLLAGEALRRLAALRVYRYEGGDGLPGRRDRDIAEAHAEVVARWSDDLCGLLNALTRGELAQLARRVDLASDGRSPELRARLWERGAELERGGAHVGAHLQPRSIVLGGHVVIQARPRGLHPRCAAYPRPLPPPAPASPRALWRGAQLRMRRLRNRRRAPNAAMCGSCSAVPAGTTPCFRSRHPWQACHAATRERSATSRSASARLGSRR